MWVWGCVGVYASVCACVRACVRVRVCVCRRARMFARSHSCLHLCFPLSSSLSLRDKFGAGSVGLLTGDAAVNRDAPILVMTTEILRNMLYGRLVNILQHMRSMLCGG